jgi:osomolarity two-component system, sensor histidine kinase TcsA
MDMDLWNCDTIFRLLVENVSDYAIFLMDSKGFVRTWNSGAESLTLYKADEIIGNSFSILYTPEDIKAFKPFNHLDIAARKLKHEDESWRVRKDGSQYWGNEIMTAIHSTDGSNLLGFAVITRDLTERRSAEEKVIMTARESERLKSDFFSKYGT